MSRRRASSRREIPAALALGPQAPRDVVVDDAQGAPRARPLGHTRSLGRRCVQCQRTIVEGRGPVARGQRRRRRRHARHRPRACRGLRRARPRRRAHGPRRRQRAGRRGRDRRTGRAGSRLDLGSPARSPSASRTSGRSTTSSSPRSTATQNSGEGLRHRARDRLVTLKLVGYTETSTPPPADGREARRSSCSAASRKDRPYPGSTTVSTVNGGVTGMVHTLAVESRRSGSTRSTPASSATAHVARQPAMLATVASARRSAAP